MDFALTETQELIRQSARDFLVQRSTPAHVRAMAADERGYSADFWRDIAELGWAGLLIPEQHGGAGMSFAEMGVLLEEWGRHLAPGPLVETAVVSAWAISHFGTDRQKREYLPRISAGELIAAPALVGPQGDWWDPADSTFADNRSGGWRYLGQRGFVSFANSADVIIPVGGSRLWTAPFLVPTAGLAWQITRMGAASGIPTYLVVIEGANLSEDGRLDAPRGLDQSVPELIRVGAAARALQMAGAGQQVLDMTVRYVSERKQFGRPVGSFQALQHKLAELATEARGARHLAYLAAWRISEGLPAAREVALAKAVWSDLLPRICSAAHQLHGAIGFTMEHDLHLYTRRAMAWSADYGGKTYHTEQAALAIGV